MGLWRAWFVAVLVGVVLVGGAGVLLGACGGVSGGVEASPPSERPPVRGGGPPPAWVESEAGSFWLAYSTYCWDRLCADYVLPRCGETRVPVVRVGVGETLRFQLGFEASEVVLNVGPPDGGWSSDSVRQFRLDPGDRTWTVEGGDSLISLFARARGGGDASYVACLRVTPEEAPSDQGEPAPPGNGAQPNPDVAEPAETGPEPEPDQAAAMGDSLAGLIDCEADHAVLETPYVGGAGAAGPLHRLPDSWLRGLDNTDRVEGSEDGARLIVNRDGRRIAALSLVEAQDGTHWIEGIAACAGDGIEPAWPPEPVPQVVPDVAEIRCGEETELVTPFVRLQSDGVHLVLTGEPGVSYYLLASGPGGGSGGRAGEEQVLNVGPGRIVLVCISDDSQQDPSEIPHRAHLTVVDPDGIHRSPELTGCRDGSRFILNSEAARTPDARGEEGPPIEVARRAFQQGGIRDDDVVERAGNPDAWPVLVRMVRDGETVLVASLTERPDRGWFVDRLTGCEEFAPSAG